MQPLDYPPLHQDALPAQNHQRNKTVTISFTQEKDDRKMYLWQLSIFQ